MPTYDQLRTESVWNDQFVPANLKELGVRLDDHFDGAATNIGIYGDNRHVRGYHRSRAWILSSRFCTSRSYSVSETIGNRSGGNANWISGIDITLGYVRSQWVWGQVNLARQRGRLAYVREVLLERDPWHVHISLDRAWANADHDELFAVITGNPWEGWGKVGFEVNLPVLKRGAEGADVVTAQALLGARGFATAVDGDFGPDTDEQTRAMQARYGAELVDGVWGKETWTIGITGEDRL